MKKIGYVIGILIVMIVSVHAQETGNVSTTMENSTTSGVVESINTGEMLTGAMKDFALLKQNIYRGDYINQTKFVDYSGAYLFMQYNGFTSKNTLAEFMPYESLTREALAKFVVMFVINIMNESPTTTGKCDFIDMDSIDPTLKSYVINACNYGVMKGSDGKFMPKNKVTRGQIITVISRILNGSIYDTTDADFYRDHALNLIDRKIITKINASENVLRGDTALMINRTFHSKEDRTLRLNDIAAKPVIYLYPQKTMDIDVKLYLSGDFLVTYPAFDYQFSGWKVIASPDGTLINKADGEEYSYLFREGGKYDTPITKGFVVAGKDTEQFLKKSLKILGLTPREYNEFIVYRLPLMKDNPYNLIHFAEKEYTDTASLEITPKPDSIQRVFMVFKSLKEKIDIPKQTLTAFKRTGFTVIERGGTQLR